MTVQFVDIAGTKMVMLPVADYERLIDIVEDKTDALAAARAEQRRVKGEEYLPSDMVDSILEGESPLRAWRKHRGMTLEALSNAAGTRKAHLSQIENGKAQGRPWLWRNLAEVLRVSSDDILPLA